MGEGGRPNQGPTRRSSRAKGFHMFDYARHFLSCYGRMLGLDYESKRGYIGLEYFGRTVYIKILPVGVHMGRLESVLNLPATSTKVKEIQEQFEGMKVILGVDDMDIFKGISLKLLALEQLLQQHLQLRGKIVLVQIVNPARGSGKDVEEAKKETYLTAKRINEAYGAAGYEPVVLVDRRIPRYEKNAYYAVAKCCIVNAVRDGMNLVPYKYIVCRQGTPSMDEALGIMKNAPRTCMLVVSEFIGCSPSLSGAIKVNPWDVDAMADALSLAINRSSSKKQLRHEKHYKYVSTQNVAYWALSSYRKTKRRAIFLDDDGTVVPETSISKMSKPEVLSVLNTLCNDPMNTVFIISGRGRKSLSEWLSWRKSLSEWLSSCKMRGIAAEHGYFISIRQKQTNEAPRSCSAHRFAPSYVSDFDYDIGAVEAFGSNESVVAVDVWMRGQTNVLPRELLGDLNGQLSVQSLAVHVQHHGRGQAELHQHREAARRRHDLGHEVPAPPFVPIDYRFRSRQSTNTHHKPRQNSEEQRQRQRHASHPLHQISAPPQRSEPVAQFGHHDHVHQTPLHLQIRQHQHQGHRDRRS
ncbi:hypothetical protein EUGRSUZ_G02474 [Eucalyptus grandis]|uniref:Uncharacterized protein n=2 Tax=Eucalyptus grandis TaxID=71139 RepID=A0ACC3K7F4_EUCGR|nr:hypothetical protein EUGRSUZ_G02474 [Eucalyptus grandis]